MLRKLFKKLKPSLITFFRAHSFLLTLLIISGFLNFEYSYRHLITYGLLIVAALTSLIVLAYPSISKLLEDALGVKGALKQWLYLGIAGILSFILIMLILELGYVFAPIINDELVPVAAFIQISIFLYLYDLYRRKKHQLLIILLFGLLLSFPIEVSDIFPIVIDLFGMSIVSRGSYFVHRRFLPHVKLIFITQLAYLVTIIVGYIITTVLILRLQHRDTSQQAETKDLKQTILNKLVLALSLTLLFVLRFGLILSWFVLFILVPYETAPPLMRPEILQIFVLFVTFLLGLGAMVSAVAKRFKNPTLKTFVIIFTSVGYYVLIGTLTTVITKNVTCNIANKIVAHRLYRPIPDYPVTKNALFPVELFDYMMYFRGRPFNDFMELYYRYYDMDQVDAAKDQIQLWVATEYCGIDTNQHYLPFYYWMP